jgi:hypothetical protein
VQVAAGKRRWNETIISKLLVLLANNPEKLRPLSRNERDSGPCWFSSTALYIVGEDISQGKSDAFFHSLGL